MRIAIVNDVPYVVEVLRQVIASRPGGEVAWVAGNGDEAVRQCALDRPDLILMDLYMPVLDGVQATDRIMRNSPCAILIVTSSVDGNTAKVFEAMGCGALDAVSSPVYGPGGTIEGSAELQAKIDTIAKLIGKDNLRPAAAAHRPWLGIRFPLVAIGASTGGPRALATVLAGLPADLDAAVVIIQHVDTQFAMGLADWLASQTRIRVTVAREGALVEKNRIFVAGTNDHLILGPNLAFHYTPEPRDNPFRPSVDAFFESARAVWPRRDVAVLLTGMGRDGARGLLALRRAGWSTIAQDESTSVVFGMPKAAIELGAADEILPLEKIPEAILRHLRT